MLKIVGYNRFTGDNNQDVFVFHTLEDDVPEWFRGCIAGKVTASSDFIEFDNGIGFPQIGDYLEIIPNLSKKGNLYKTYKITSP